MGIMEKVIHESGELKVTVSMEGTLKAYYYGLEIVRDLCPNMWKLLVIPRILGDERYSNNG